MDHNINMLTFINNSLGIISNSNNPATSSLKSGSNLGNNNKLDMNNQDHPMQSVKKLLMYPGELIKDQEQTVWL